MKPRLITPISISLQPSNLLLGLLWLISIISLWIVLQLGVENYIKWLLCALIIASSVYYSLRDVLLMHSTSWQQLQVTVKGELRLTNKRGEIVAPRLAKSTLVLGWLIVLNFKNKGFLQGLPPAILIGQTDQIRQLRIWLRWWRHQEDLAVPDEVTT